MSARDEILARVRAALRDVPADERPEDVAVPRGYRRSGELSREQVLDLFSERVRDYGATVTRAAAGEVAAALGEICRRHGATTLVAPAGLPDAWRPVGVELVADEGLGPHELDALDGVVTGCALAVADSGTIALDAGPDQGRRALTLVPDLHLCVVTAEQVVELLPEAMGRLAATVRGTGKPVVLVSGPSATSDIELHRVQGVHGPRRLEVLVVGD